MASEMGVRIGRRIKEARTEAGLKQRELADRIGEPVDGQRVSDWERALAIFGGEKRSLVAVDAYGNATVQKV